MTSLSLRTLIAAALTFSAASAFAPTAGADDGAKPPVQRKFVKPPVVKRIQNPDKTFTPGADYDTIVKRGWISFGVYADFAPYSWKEGDTLKGVDVALAKMIAKALGVEARFKIMVADENVDSDLRNYVWKGPTVEGGADRRRSTVNVMMHVPWDREFATRNELVVMTGRYMAEAIAIAYRKDAYPEDPPTPAYFRYDKVGVENDSVADFYLATLSRGQLIGNMRRYPTIAAAMAALEAGEVKAVVGPRAQLEHGLTAKTAVHQPPLPGLTIGVWPLGVAIRHNYRQLAYAVDDAIQAARADGRLQAAFKRYGLTYRPPNR